MAKNKKLLFPTDRHYKAIQWCINNNIKVAVHPTRAGLKVVIDENGLKSMSPGTYTNNEANDKVWELYLYLYDKYWKV